jgi:hypothetical protein
MDEPQVPKPNGPELDEGSTGDETDPDAVDDGGIETGADKDGADDPD